MNPNNPKALMIIRQSFRIGNHPSIGRGVNIHEYEDTYSPLLRVGQIVGCYSLDDVFYFKVDVITSHEFEIIRGCYMTENKAITDDLQGKVKKPNPIFRSAEKNA